MRMALCHPDRKHRARGLCNSCYTTRMQAKGRGEEVDWRPHPPKPKVEVVEPPVANPSAPKPNLRNTATVEHIARAIVVNMMDVHKAVRQLMPDLSDLEVGDMVKTLENNPTIRAAIQLQLQKDGLDEDSAKTYVRLMWFWMLEGSERQKLKAAGILGKGFVGEKVQIETPEELPFQDFSRGVKNMLGPTPAEQVGKKQPTKDTSTMN